MKLMTTEHVQPEKASQFLYENDAIDKDELYENGYMVEIEENIEGCFVLQELHSGGYWLKQLHVTKKAAPSLPVLLESVLAIARKRQAKIVYVHSHQPVVDIVLQALQFYPQDEQAPVDETGMMDGNWWAYAVL